LFASLVSQKKKFIYLNKDVLEHVTRLISALGITYYQAQGESDALCAALVIQKKAWACLSEDMDMFVYGTTRVLRYFSLHNHNVVVYNLDMILSELGVSQKELREICVLSGTDYLKMGVGEGEGKGIKKIHLYNVLKWFKKYHKQQNQNKNNKTLYDFVIENECIQEDDVGKLMQIDKIFASSMFIKGDSISSHAYIHHSKHTNAEIIKEILEDNGFLFGPGPGLGL
jgi:DNA excision repair protein ERCC-5